MNNLSQEDFKRKLGDQILHFRTKVGLTQEELAFRIGKDKQFINRYEVQGANPTAYTLVVLCKALEISVSEFLNVKF